MKKVVLTFAIVFNLGAQAGVLDSVKDYYVEKTGSPLEKVARGLVAPSTACLDYMEARGFDQNEDLFDACLDLNTTENFECAYRLLSSTSVRSNSLKACSGVENRYALNLQAQFMRKYNSTPFYTAIIAFGAVDNEREYTCMNNYFRKDRFQISEIESKCLEEEPSVLDQREYDIMGHVLSPRTATRSVSETGRTLIESIKDVFNF